MKRILKIILINILVFASLVIILEFTFGLLVDARHYLGKENGEIRKIRSLPVFNKYKWSDKYFDEHETLDHDYRSYYGWRMKEFRGDTINVDRDGIRKTLPQQGLAKGSPSIAFLGGSTIWGYGVNDENTIPSWFGKKSKKEYRLNNYGDFGFSAYQGYLFLQNRMLNGQKPTHIISYEGVNNSPANLPRFFAHAKEEVIDKRMWESDTQLNYKPYSFRGAVEFASSVKRYYARFTSPEAKGETKTYSKDENRRSAVELLETWLLLQNLSDEIGAEFVCALQPVAYYANPDTEMIKEILAEDPYKNGYGYYTDVFELLETEKYSGLKKDFVDMTASLDKIPEMFIDFCHLSPKGNEKIAELFVEQIEQKKPDESQPENTK